jgi:hypothetical protein
LQTQCNHIDFEFQAHNRKKVISNFNGGHITSDGGAILLREFEKRKNILKRFAECFTDYRKQDAIEHSVEELISQRIFGIMLGYEDLNDHDELRRDVFLSLLSGKKDPTGQDRRLERDKGCALAGKSTLNRLELTSEEASETERYKKISYNKKAIERLLVDVFLESYKTPLKEIILDCDATDDPLYGKQEGRFFHGYYYYYCYLPLYIFCGEHLLSALLRPSNIDASEGVIDELTRIVSQIRESWPDVKIIVRGDSGFCREEIMKWCEDNGIDYVFGLAKNKRLRFKISKQMEHARRRYLRTGTASRAFRNFNYRTLKSWSKKRRVIGKAEYLSKGENPRFAVTSLSRAKIPTRELYEKLYCARGDMENRIKEQQLDLFADRTSTALMRSNQLRLFFSSIAYVIYSAFRRIVLKGTDWAKYQCNTIREKLFKIGALVKISFRRILIEFAGGYPYKDIFERVHRNIYMLQLC